MIGQVRYRCVCKLKEAIEEGLPIATYLPQRTAGQHMAALGEFVETYKPTNTMLAGVLKMVETCLPGNDWHPATLHQFLGALGISDEEDNRLHLCNDCCGGHVFDHLPKASWPTHQDDVCPNCNTPRFKTVNKCLEPNKSMYLIDVEDTLNLLMHRPEVERLHAAYKASKAAPPAPGTFDASPACQHVRSVLGDALYDDPWSVRVGIGLDWVDLGGTSVG
ncbi:uncharacterized protein HaLaN_02701, partial [Haematococcus lacustris]